MLFRDLCSAFYKPINGLRGKEYRSKAAIARFLISSAAGYEVDYDDSYYARFFDGKVDIPVWDTIEGNLSNAAAVSTFSEALRLRMSTEAIPKIMEELGVRLGEDEEPDAYLLSAAVAEQMRILAIGRGEGDGIVDKRYHELKAPAEWGEYIKKARRSYAKCKTLFYRTADKPFDKFYVCNNISRAQSHFTKSSASEDDRIIDADREQIFRDCNCILLIGMEGIGKTMMMRNLFLNAADAYGDEGTLPVLVFLRDYEGEIGIMGMLAEAASHFDRMLNEMELHKLLDRGKCLVLMDGLDEIRHEKFKAFVADLTRLVETYPDSKFVISTRNYSLLSASRFQQMWILPFEKEQSRKLVEMLDISQTTKEYFLSEGIEEFYEKYREYLLNPMLFTLVLMTYDDSPCIPENKHVLYERAYETLLREHDSVEKDAYDKEFHSVSTADEFTSVFGELCARTCWDGIIKFDRKEYKKQYKKLLSVNDVQDQRKMTQDNLLDDICYKACMMYQDRQDYVFLHRSFQEYLFADYYGDADDECLENLRDHLSGAQKCRFDNEDAFRMLYESERERVRRLIFFPFLKSIFGKYDERVMFWTYLKRGYGEIRMRGIFRDEAEKHGEARILESINVNAPNNFLFSMIAKLNDIDLDLSVNFDAIRETDAKLAKDLVIAEKIGRGQSKTYAYRAIPKSPDGEGHAEFSGECIRDGNGDPVIFGLDYVYDPSEAIRERDKHTELQDALYDRKSKIWEQFDKMRDVYDEIELESKYSAEDAF